MFKDLLFRRGQGWGRAIRLAFKSAITEPRRLDPFRTTCTTFCTKIIKHYITLLLFFLDIFSSYLRQFISERIIYINFMKFFMALLHDLTTKYRCPFSK